MRNIKRVGVAKISRLTFFLVFVLFVVIFLAKSCFFDSVTQINKEDTAPISISTSRTITESGKLNVSQERYYYDLGLLAPVELPDLYQPSSSMSIANTPIEAILVGDSLSDYNDSVSFFDNIKLTIDLDPQKDETISDDTKVITDVESQLQGEQILEEFSDVELGDNETSEALDDTVFDDEFDDVVFDDEFDDVVFDDEFDDISFGDEPWDGGFAGDLGTPFEPLLFAPLVQTQEEYDLFNPKNTNNEPLTEDFFDDFYIAGESEQSLYEDGSYFLSLIVNGERSGDVETKFEGSEYSLGVQSLFESIGNLLSESAINRIFADAPEYYTIEQLKALGVDTEIDTVAFEVTMEFGTEDIPLQYIPINKIEKNSLLSRNEKYGISDANVIAPSFISFVSALNLSTSYSYGSAIGTKILRNSLNMNNSLSIGEVAVDISNSFQLTISSSATDFDFQISPWKGYFDIRDKNLRVSFGNVGSYLGTNGTPVGLTIEKNYSFGVGDPLPHQFTKRYLLKSDSFVYVYINEEPPVIKRLRKGEYILKDFPFKQGANHVRIRIEPDNKIYPIVLDEFDVPYDSRLLSKGDYLYGFSAAISKSERTATSSSKLTLPYLDGKFYDYDFSDFDTRLYLDVGLTHTISLNSSFAFSVEQIKSTFEGVFATMAGPFTGSLSSVYTAEYSPEVSASISHTIDTPIGGINSSFTLKLPVWESGTGDLYSASDLSVSLGYSFAKDNFPPLNTTLSATFNNSGIKWQSTLSTNYSPLPGLSINGSLNIGNVNYSSEINISLQLGFGFTLLNNMTATQSLSSTGASNLSINYKPTNTDSLQFSIGGIQYFTNTKPVYNLAWQHTDNFYSLLLKQNMANDFTVLNTAATVSSALFFADGLFAINKSGASNFIIVKPEGELANNPISIGKTNSSALSIIDTVFGNAVYPLLAANSRNNLILYGTSKSLYSSGGSFSFELNTSTRTGFSQRLSSPKAYTVSGLLLQEDGTPFVQYSSPVYKLLEDENGLEYLEPDEQLYLFTDLDGRFILSDVVPGTYLFDMAVENNQWYGLYFVVGGDLKTDEKVILLKDYQLEIPDEITTAFEVESTEEGADTESTFGDELASDYLDIVELTLDRYEDEQTFWDTIFPPIEEGVDDLAFEDTAGAWEKSTVEEVAFDESVFENDPAFSDTAEDWQSAIDDTVIPTVVVDNTQQNPNYTYVP